MRKPSRRRAFGLGVVASLIALWGQVSYAQTNFAEISGLVTDPQGETVAGAAVSAQHLGSRVTVDGLTDAGGRFLLPALPIGEYSVTVSQPRFKRAVREGIVVHLGQKLEIEVRLEVGSLSEEITVHDERALLQTTTSDISGVVSNRQVVELPLNGRQFLQLALLTDNVVIPPGGTRGAALQQAGTLFNVAGQRSGHNIYLLDGVKVTDEYFNNMVVSLSPDAIQEFKIQKTQYPAEFGGKASALINVATRSGSESFHGSAVEFLRNSALDARNYFDDPTRPVPPLRQNQFGASLGGPLVRGRTFFFANYEGLRAAKSLTRTFSVPSADRRAGDFGPGSSICDPTTIPLTGRCEPFPGGHIPAGRIDPIAAALLTKVPLPTGPGEVQNLTAAEKQRTDMDQFSLRLDHRLTDWDQLTARFTTYGVADEQPFGTTILNESLVPGFGREVTTRSHNLSLTYVHRFGDRVSNEVRVGYLGVKGGQFSLEPRDDFAAQVGLQGVTHDPRDVGYPQVSLAGLYNTIGDPTTFTTRENTSFEFYDNLLVDRGAHRMKFGAYLFHLRFRPESPDLARGAFTFTGQFTGNALADFLLGYPAASQAGTGRADENGRTTWLHLYAQDDWRVSPNFTVNAGLRVEFNRHMEDVDNRLSSVDLETPGGRFVVASDDAGNISPTATDGLARLPLPWVTSEAAGWDRSLVRPDYKRLAPRLGLVYRIPGAHETVVRAAAGIFLNQWAYSVQQAFAKNLPFFFTRTVSAPADARVPTGNTATILTHEVPGTVGASIMDWDYQVEFNHTYTLDVQRLLTPRTRVDLSLMLSRTVGADSSTVRNIPEPGPGAIAPRRPVPQLGPVAAIRWDGWEHYQSATVRVERQAARGLALSASYTWSRSIDDASDPGTTVAETNLPQNVYDMRPEAALSSYDHRHRVVATFSYELPWSRGALKGWRLSGIATVQSGAPLTVNLGTDRANIGTGPAQRPDVSGDPNLDSGRTPQRWFDTSAFTLPAPFTFGNSGRNTVIGPGYANVDLALSKTARVAGRTQIEMRWEVFNVLNHPNFDLPNRTAFTPNFGRIFSAGDSRQMQLGARVTF